MPQETDKARLERMIQMKDQMEKASFKGGFISLKNEGDHRIRILPRVKAVDPSEPFFVHKWVHYVRIPNENTRMVLCRQKGLGEPCPVCEFIEEIQRNGTNEQKKLVADWGTGNKEYLIFRALDESGQVKLYAYNKSSVNTAILNLTIEYEQKGIAADDKEKGYWININRIGKGRNDTRYTVKAVKITDPNDPTSEKLDLHHLSADILSQLSEMVDLAEQFRYRTYEETDTYFKTGERPENGAAETKEIKSEIAEEEKVIDLNPKKEELKQEEQSKEEPEKKSDPSWGAFLNTATKKK